MNFEPVIDDLQYLFEFHLEVDLLALPEPAATPAGHVEGYHGSTLFCHKRQSTESTDFPGDTSVNRSAGGEKELAGRDFP